VCVRVVSVCVVLCESNKFEDIKKFHRFFEIYTRAIFTYINIPNNPQFGRFFRITQYIGDTHNARTLIPMNTRTQTIPLGASSTTAGKSSRLTKLPQAPRCRRERCLPLKVQTPLNHEKFAPTRSRTQDMRYYRSSYNH
jgi:hypothetical protein